MADKITPEVLSKMVWAEVQRQKHYGRRWVHVTSSLLEEAGLGAIVPKIDPESRKQVGAFSDPQALEKWIASMNVSGYCAMWPEATLLLEWGP